ncbi:MAG: short chain dehydrogenase [Porticoccaceae bacterium]|nr:MAG: short chain dehydrogenase [Porticoccaceae bacterium]
MGERPAALVTGGAIRVGRHFCETLARLGYDVAVHYHRSAEAAQETVASLRALGVEAHGFAHDLAGPDPAALVDRVVEVFPRLCVLVNCASTYRAASVAETDYGLLEGEFRVNFFAPFLLTGAFARRVERGNVVNILDNKIAFNQYQYAAYLSAKKALAELTRMAAMEFAPRIRVNGIAPGVVLPGSNRSADYIAWRVEGIPLKRQGKLTELGRALAYLLENEFVTGQILFVDGGESVAHVGRNAEAYAPARS